MQKIKIGTLISVDNVKQVMPQLIPYGFETFSITFWETVEGWDLEVLAAEVQEILKGTDCKISCLSIFGNPLSSTNKGLKTVEGWEKLIDSAHLFGTDLVTGFAGRVAGVDVAGSIPRFKEVFTNLAERAIEKDVRLAIENCEMGDTWENGVWNIGYSSKAWEMMFEAVPHKNLGLQWEPCHQLLQLVEPLPQLRKWAHKVFSVHGKDGTIAWDVIREKGINSGEPYAWHRTPGFGDSNWVDLITVLRMSGYEGSIDIEGFHDPVYKDDLEYTGQVHSLNYLKQCRGGDLIPNFEHNDVRI